MKIIDNNVFAPDEIERESLPLKSPIISYGADYTIESIAQYVSNETILIQPDFQRKSVWDIKKASKLIESFLLGYPVPNILLGRPQNDDRMEVIDGQQRIRAISDFIQGTFNKEQVFRLTGDILPHYLNKTFRDLEDTDQRRLKNAVLKAIVLVYQDNDPNLKYSVFQRINTGSMVLNQQEIRNCIFGGSFNTLLHNLNEEKIWRTFFSLKPDKRMRDEEAILRFFASYFDRNEYEKPMTSFLNRFMSKNQHIEGEIIEKWRTLFLGTLQTIEDNFTKRESPFSTKTGSKQFNRALFEAIMVAVAILKDEGKTDFDDFRNKHAILLADSDFLDSVSTGTSSEKKYELRLRIAYETLK